MELCKRYHGYIISRIVYPKTWQVFNKSEMLKSFTSRQQARDYIKQLVKENHGNSPAGVQDTKSTS